MQKCESLCYSCSLLYISDCILDKCQNNLCDEDKEYFENMRLKLKSMPLIEEYQLEKIISPMYVLYEISLIK